MQTPSDYIILLARQRSGTNPLRSVLEGHPEIACTEEVLNHRPTPDYQLELETNYFRFLDARFEGSLLDFISLEDQEQVFLDFLDHLRAVYDKRYLVIDIKYNSTHHLDAAWRFITEEPALFGFVKKHGLRVVNLTRQNFLRYYVSEMKAQRSGTWDVFDEKVVGDRPWYIQQYLETGRVKVPYRDTKIQLDPEEMVATLELCRSENDVVTAAFKDYEHYITFDYQDVFPRLNSPPASAVLTGIADWLGLGDEFSEKRPQYKKQSALPLDETIENYGQVTEALRGSDFEYCLTDERMYTAPPAAAERAESPLR
jgi:hypothetical protein